jgi:hypothetical protein
MSNSVMHHDFLGAAKPPPVSAGCSAASVHGAAALIPCAETENCYGGGARYAAAFQVTDD